jgi:hypothetical protein
LGISPTRKGWQFPDGFGAVFKTSRRVWVAQGGEFFATAFSAMYGWAVRMV